MQKEASGRLARDTSADELLECVKVVAAHFGVSTSDTVLTSSLPLTDGRLTVDLLPRAAERIGLVANMSSRRLKQIGSLDLPAILLRRDDRPIVLIEKTGRGYRAYFPEDNTSREVAYSEIDAVHGGACVTFKQSFVAPGSEAAAPARGAWFWPAVHRYGKSYRSVILASLVINVIALIFPLFTMNVYDRVLPNKAFATLWVFAAGLGAALIFDYLLKVARSQLVDRVGRRIDLEVGSTLIAKILATRLTERSATSGVLANRMQEYEAIRDFLSSSTLMLFVDLAFFLLFTAVIYLIGGWLVIIPLVALVIVFVTGFILQFRLSDLVRRAQDESALRHSVLVEAISALETIKTVRAEGYMLGRWERLARSAAESSEEAKHITAVALNFTGFVQQLVSIGIIVAGTYQFAEGQMSMGAIIATSMLSGRLVAPLSQIAMLFSRLHYVRLSFRHFNEIMAKPDETIAGPGFVNRRIENGAIAFRNVEFSYPEATSPVLTAVNIEIRPGERVGIVGRIGSGKTTLGRLVTGLYHPTAGEVLIDGIDIRQYHPHEIRTAIALVAQDADLLHGSVRDNILMANPIADDEAIVRAARLSGVDEFVAGNPRGFEMPVGERGSRLSGGQRQCVALARAILVDSRVLFLDEPSSAMDLQSERQLIERLRTALAPGRTAIIATHRQSMLQLVDRLIVLDGGRIVADGPRDRVIEALRNPKGPQPVG